MNGTGVPFVTPYDETGAVDHDALDRLVGWLEDRGVDFFVPCGSTGEAPLLTTQERTSIVETVARATENPVVAGTGHEGYEPTLEATRAAADVGADAALVLTPSYYGTNDGELEAYYRDLADESPIPIYLYSVPKFTNLPIPPTTAAALASHGNVAGIKDSSGSIESITRLVRLTADEDFSVLVGSGSVYAPALDAGAEGGILALANLVPERASEVYRLHTEGEGSAARELNAALVELNRAATARFGIPGIKAALELRGQPVGDPRRPLRPAGDTVTAEFEALFEDALEA